MKAAGHKKHDVKCGTVTIVDKDKKRTNYSVGYSANISHSGGDAAESVRHTLTMMAVLTSTSYEEVKQHIDLWMVDRAGDGAVMLQDLEVEEERRVNCNAHVILCESNCLDQVFKETEDKIGREKLISTNAAHCFNSPSSSIWYLGLIALAKYLSPSHAQESVSMHTAYLNFLKADIEDKDSDTSDLSAELLKSNFKGFQANRFGRTGMLSETVIKHHQVLLKFFESSVDENQNKLALACYSYLHSEFFMMCCSIAAYSFENLIKPLMEALGIDQYKKVKSKYRSWDGLKSFFQEKDLWLESKSNLQSGMVGKDLLQCQAFVRIREGWKNQLSSMKFYNEEESVSESTMNLMRKSNVLTNLGAESKFAELDNRLKVFGGTTSLETLSNKDKISSNKLFMTENWKEKSRMERKAQWVWARKSTQAKKVKEMGKEYLKKVLESEKVNVEQKVLRKKKLNQRSLKLLNQCKTHAGPLSSSDKDMDLLSKLSTKELILEVRYLRTTIGPNIKEKRRIRDSNGKYKFEKFSDDELRMQIKSVLRPEVNAEQDLEQLNQILLDVLGNTINPVLETAQVESIQDIVKKEESDLKTSSEYEVGSAGWWAGPLGERCVGVLLDSTTLQTFEAKQFGFAPSGYAADISEWKVIEVIENPYYVVVQSDLYMKF